MALCYYVGTSRRGSQQWGSDFSTWTATTNVEDEIVQYCRKAFGKRYRDMWIDPLYFDDKYFRYTEKFFSEVGVQLYPKITNLSKELKRRGIEPPKTKDEWIKYRAIVWEIVHKDIAENINKGVKPVDVVVTGIRYSDNRGNFKESIKSVKKVKRLRQSNKNKAKYFRY